MPLFTRLLRAGETKLVKRLGKIAAHIDTLEPEVQKLTDAELRAKTDEFRARYADGESLDELLPEAFAVAREARGAHDRPAPLPRAAHGRRGAAPGQHRGDEDR